VSLETRIPFLDTEVYKYAWQLPFNYKVAHGEGKIILKNLLTRYIPQHLIDRPKSGFGIPIDSWLRGTLKEWGEALLNPILVRSQGYLNADLVYSYWQKHQNRQANYGYLLWNILMFQAWLEDQAK
jgi:asparagine synthase (glutamine-hydrolysing)